MPRRRTFTHSYTKFFTFSVDILNLPSKYLFSYNIKITYTVIATTIILFILSAVDFGLLDTFKMLSINFVDNMALIVIISSFMYGIVSIAYSQLYYYKLVILLCSILIFGFILMRRGIRWKRSVLKAVEYKPNIVDLKDIFSGKIKEILKSYKETVFVNERDVDYDLLERESIINSLYNAICNCTPESSFVISLEGKWGSGKTTIINNVKRKIKEFNKNIVIIDEFDPWSFCDQESMFFSMFDIILQKTGFKYSNLATKKMIESIGENIFGSQKYSFIFKSFFGRIDDISILKNKINDYLRLSGKKFVFFIDNIDRAESENVILMFKLISNILDFERVTYVLSFDNDRVKDIFEKQSSIDYSYLKKIIQLQIRVPEINRNVLCNFLKKCLHNLLLAYGESTEELKNYDHIINFMTKQSIDIRDFKRFINSVIGISFVQIKYLCKKDLLVIEYVKMFNLELYQQIYFNREFFISHDRMYDEYVYITTFNREYFNKKAKEFFDDLFSNEKNECYIEFLCEIFPYVKKYSKNEELMHKYEYYDQDYSYVAKNAGICSAKYFDLYFTYTSNEYTFILDEVKEFIDDIKQASDFNCKVSKFDLLLDSSLDQREMFEKFQLYLEEFSEDISFDIVRILFNRIDSIDNSFSFFNLNAYKRAIVIIWELLNRIDDSHYDEFLFLISSEYGKIEVISRILYWFEHDREGKNIEGRADKLKKVYEEMCSTIYSKVINLYDDKYYYPKNIFGFYRIYKDDSKKIKSYFKKILNEKNIFRFLYDICNLAVGTEYEYSIQKNNIDPLTTEEEIDRILKKAKPKSEDEQFILDVYRNYKKGVIGNWGIAGLTTDREKKLKL